MLESPTFPWGAEALRGGWSAWGTLLELLRTWGQVEGKSEEGTSVNRTSSADRVLMSAVLKMKNTIFSTQNLNKIHWEPVFSKNLLSHRWWYTL